MSAPNPGQDDELIIESGSSGPGTPMGPSNPETPCSVPDVSEVRNTPPPPPSLLPHSSSTASLTTMAGFGRPSVIGGGLSLHVSPSLTSIASQSKYAQLLAVIEEMGKDIRPTYAGSKTSSERLKRGIMHARILVRECLMECDRAART